MIPLNRHIALVIAISFALVLAVTSWGAGQQPSSARQQPSGTLHVRSCTVDSLPAWCGTLFVPEGHDILTKDGYKVSAGWKHDWQGGRSYRY